MRFVWMLALPLSACSGGGPAGTPLLSVTPEAFDFGASPVDAPTTRDLTLTNEGGGEIVLLSVTLTEGDPDVWSTDRGDVSVLGAGESGVVEVRFRPEEQRLYTGELQVRTDLALNGSATIVLRGSGGLSGVDEDGDGFSEADGDCDDGNPYVNPAADEVCDGVDTDCNGNLPANEADDDDDGWPVCAGDCDDGNADTYPGATEICDGLDNDCNKIVPDKADQDGDGRSICDGDCDDTEGAVYPGAEEICDELDNDCDGGVDNLDFDGDGHTICSPLGDCNDKDPNAFPVVISPGGDDAGQGTEADPYETLAHALANLDDECRMVVVEPGTYGDVSEVWAAGDVTIVGRTGDPADVVLQAAAYDRHLDVTGGTLTLEDLSLVGGEGADDGGSVQIVGADVVLDNVSVDGNQSQTDGGGIAVISGTLTLQNGCVFSGNGATDDGGALVLSASTLIDTGGTLYDGNSAVNGGAIRLEGGSATIRSATFDDNEATEGGAISATGAGTFVVERNALWRNEATGSGGGIALRDVDSPAGGVRANRLQDNTASDLGGGIAVLGGTGDTSVIDVHNNTLTGNEAVNGEGAGIAVAATLGSGVSVVSNVLHSNDGASAIYTAEGSGAVVDYCSAFGTNSGVHFAGDVGDGAGGPLKGSSNAVRNPLLVTLSDDGDPTNDDLDLQAASPEIDDGPIDVAFDDPDGTRNDRGYTGGPAAAP
ncbi:MAG: hypothetical protein KTR31_30535 [Myxococcales bacterium]|nr:hypothetical protein [Myxococcales bacterium]